MNTVELDIIRITDFKAHSLDGLYRVGFNQSIFEFREEIAKLL